MPWVTKLIADVTVNPNISIFIGCWMNYNKGWNVWGTYTWQGSGRLVGVPMEGEWPGESGWVHNRLGNIQVYNCECGWNHCGLVGRMPTIPKSLRQRLLKSADFETLNSVDVIRMHLHFDGFFDEPIHVASFWGEDCSVLISDDVVMIEIMSGNRWFIWLNQSRVSLVLFNADLDGPSTLSDVHFDTFTRVHVYAWYS